MAKKITKEITEVIAENLNLPTLRKIEYGYKKIQYDIFCKKFEGYAEDIDDRLIREIIEYFSKKDFKVPTEYKKNRGIIIGLAISALINSSQDDEFILPSLDGIHMIGAFNENKYIIVKGNTGSMSGIGMKGGKLTIEGNAQGKVGAVMIGGEIYVKGDPGYDIGFLMEGKGEIYGDNILPKNISNYAKKGWIFRGSPQRHMLVWYNGKLMTNEDLF